MPLQLTVGQKATRTLTVTAEYVRLYAQLSGDYNPLHLDATRTARPACGRLPAAQTEDGG
ncbi:MAG: MaoC/PaaZ C-terminal domain-containing protein [Chloroflexota bacterium]